MVIRWNTFLAMYHSQKSYIYDSVLPSVSSKHSLCFSVKQFQWNIVWKKLFMAEMEKEWFHILRQMAAKLLQHKMTLSEEERLSVMHWMLSLPQRMRTFNFNSLMADSKTLWWRSRGKISYLWGSSCMPTRVSLVRHVGLGPKLQLHTDMKRFILYIIPAYMFRGKNYRNHAKRSED